MKSVREIKKECEEVLAIADSIDDSIQVLMGANILKDSIKEMMKMYSDELYNEKEISKLKEYCIKNAITLEYLLMGKNDKVNKRYKNRVEITLLIDGITSKISEVSNDKEQLAELLAKRKLVKRLALKTSQINFQFSEKDLEDIKDVRRFLYGEREVAI